MLNNLKQFVLCENGSAGIEYALLGGIFAAFVAASAITLGPEVSLLFAELSKIVEAIG